MMLVAWSRTDTGRKRNRNEDSWLVDVPLGLFAVADGMGGHQGGKHASTMAIKVLRAEIALSYEDFEAAAVRLREEFNKRWAPEDDDEPDTTDLGRMRTEALDETMDFPSEPADDGHPAASIVMRIAARNASMEVYDASQNDPELRGMGTTLTALLFETGRVHVVHAGDSRAYLFRDGRIRQITEDHSWIQEQVRAGIMSAEEAEGSELRHIITRSIGVERDVEVDAEGMPVEAGDCYLLCSDGMSNYVGNDELEKLMSVTWYKNLPQLLIDIANERGGDDNITVVVVYAANETE